LLFAASSGAIEVARRTLGRRTAPRVALAAAVALVAAACSLYVYGHRELAPDQSAHRAIVAVAVAIACCYGFVCIAMASLCLARHLNLRLDRSWRVTFDCTRGFWHYSVAQSLVGIALVQGFPRVVAA
jgi:hypothetical protein